MRLWPGHLGGRAGHGLVTTSTVDVSWDVVNDTEDSLYLLVSRFFVDTVSRSTTPIPPS